MKAARRRGVLIALEGIDGAGKSTLGRSLAVALRRRGYSVALRREPADPRIGRLAQEAGDRDPWTSAVYFTVDRHLARSSLETDLAEHDVVITDRSFFSTLAYQGSLLNERDRRRLTELERVSTVAPNEVLLLDLPVPEALPRVGERSARQGTRRGPLERARTLRRVARAYRRLAREHRWIVMDARRPPRELVATALERLGLRGPARTTAGQGNRYASPRSR